MAEPETSSNEPVTQGEGFIARNPKKVLLLANLLLLLGFELVLRVLANFGYIRIIDYPTTELSERFLGDINEHFGVWHYPNRTARHQTPCFDVQYASNSYGARDIEREKHSRELPRVVVLGDSFVEGYGATLDDRMTNVAERITSREFLNFGVSGNFGPIQQWLLYRELASKFDHTHVAIFLLPANDFDDINPKEFKPSRYRPYLRPSEDGGFELYYTVPFSERDDLRSMSAGRKFRRNLYNQIYILNLIRQFGMVLEKSAIKDSVQDNVSSTAVTPYNDFSQGGLEQVLYSYRQILEIAGDRQVSIFIVPTEEEFHSSKINQETSKIVAALSPLTNEFKNLQIVDLLPVFKQYLLAHNLDYDELTLKCDSHWSALGNRVAGEALAKVIG